MAKAKRHTVTSANDNSYIVTLTGNEQWSAAAKSDPGYVLFTFSAPEDASKDEITGEIDYLELTAEDEVADDDSFDDEDELDSSFY